MQGWKSLRMRDYSTLRLIKQQLFLFYNHVSCEIRDYSTGKFLLKSKREFALIAMTLLVP